MKRIKFVELVFSSVTLTVTCQTSIWGKQIIPAAAGLLSVLAILRLYVVLSGKCKDMIDSRLISS